MQVRELADAGEHILAPRDIRLARLARRCDLALDLALLKCGEGAAGLFDLLEQRPRLLAEFSRQALDAAGLRQLLDVMRRQDADLCLSHDAPWVPGDGRGTARLSPSRD